MNRSSRVYLVEPQPTVEEYRARIEFLQGRIRALETENRILRGNLDTVTKKLNAAAQPAQSVPPLTQSQNDCTPVSTEPECARGGARDEHVG